MPKATPSLNAMAKTAKGKKPRAPKKVKESDAQQKTLSTEFVEDSGDESEAGSDSDAESLPKVPSEKPSKEASKPNFKPSPSEGSSSSSENESGSEESSGESGAEEHDSGSEETELQKSKVTNGVSTTSAAPARYIPPTGFESTTIQDEGTVASSFKKATISGKQIWHITAPSLVPISSIQSMTLLDIKNGDSVYARNGIEYGFSQATQDDVEESSNTVVMAPNRRRGYQIVSKPIDRVLHLRRLVTLPSINDSEAPSKATIPAKKPVRKQPKGLRMRFLPIGFGEGDAGKLGSESSGDSDIEMEEAPEKTSFIAPELPEANVSAKKEKSSKKKRKHEESGKKLEKKSKNSSS